MKASAKNVPTILAIDPGETIGWALAPSSAITSWDASKIERGEIDAKTPRNGWTGRTAGVLAVLVMMKERNVETLIVEGWNPRPGATMTAKSVEPIYILSALAFALEQKWWGGEYIVQMPSEKGVMTNDRLKKAGLWTVGKDHARDATRHLVVYVRKRRGKLGRKT